MVDVDVLSASDQDGVLLRVREPLRARIVAQLTGRLRPASHLKQGRRGRLALGRKTAKGAASLIHAPLHTLQHLIPVLAGYRVEYGSSVVSLSSFGHAVVRNKVRPSEALGFPDEANGGLVHLIEALCQQFGGRTEAKIGGRVHRSRKSTVAVDVAAQISVEDVITQFEGANMLLGLFGSWAGAALHRPFPRRLFQRALCFDVAIAGDLRRPGVLVRGGRRSTMLRHTEALIE